jgi:hypothetical protein
LRFHLMGCPMTENGGADPSDHHDRPEPNDNDLIFGRSKQHWGYTFGYSALFLIADFGFFWPENHFWALLLFAAGLGLLAWLELPPRLQLPGAAAAFVVCGIAYFLIGPIPVPEQREVGEIFPSNEPDPVPEACGKAALKIILGDMAMAISDANKGEVPVLSFGDYPVFSIAKTEHGMEISANIYDPDTQQLAATIQDNKFTVLTNKRIRLVPSADLSTLAVDDENGRELIYVRFLNPKTIRVRGIFSRAGYENLTVTDTHAEPLDHFRPHICIRDIPFRYVTAEEAPQEQIQTEIMKIGNVPMPH